MPLAGMCLVPVITHWLCLGFVSAGVAGNNAFYCCRYCHKHKKFFSVPSTGWPHPYKGSSMPSPPLRGSYNTVYDAHRKATAKVRQANGWGPKPGPFWGLTWMHNHHYQCFGMCYLHLHSLGLAKVCAPTKHHI